MWRNAARRGVRVRVDDQGRLTLTEGHGQQREITRRNDAGDLWWVNDPAAVHVGLTKGGPGWLVVTGRDHTSLVALQVSDWLVTPTAAPVAAAEDLRAAGVQAIADALGVRFEAVSDPTEVTRRVSRVTTAAIWRPKLVRSSVLAALGLLLAMLLLAAGGIVVSFLPWPVEVPALGVLVALPRAAYELWRVGSGRRVRRLLRDRRWTVASRRRGGGIGMSTSGDLVISDGRWEQWFVGPDAGGAAAFVVAVDEAGRPWSLQLFDRDEHLLALLPADDWLESAEPPAVAELREKCAALELSVSVATRERDDVVAGRAALSLESVFTARLVVGASALPAFVAVIGGVGTGAARAVVAGAILVMAVATNVRRPAA